uniref:BTB domain-containing protein n=1 Tax=Skeletonema marinoi TaxID=267567 RepID=A0A7S2KUB0_9STRA|mmetsp:Transcript_17003/g.28815  ORF Transcript_17003/g.28815 Transcript_17003/m.28815 type:complete len:339 (+) Transcript_17003:1-1017(+)
MNYSLGKENNSSKNEEPCTNSNVKCYHVHKAILSVGPRRSDYFATLFKQSHLSEFATNTSHIQLEPSAADSFPALLDYIYTEKMIKFSAKNATALRHLAHYFGMRPLWKQASAFIRGDFSLDTAATYLSEAIVYHDEKLENASIAILAENIEEINRRTLTKLSPSSFERIFASPRLKCRSRKLSDIVLKYCQTQGGSVDMSLLMKCTRSEVMPSVSRKAALPLLKVAVAGEQKAGVDMSNTHNVLRARCVETCVEEWKETLAKPLMALECRDKNISRILGASSLEHRDLPLTIQVELLEKALCAAKVELDDVKAELLFREEQVEEFTKQGKSTGKSFE